MTVVSSLSNQILLINIHSHWTGDPNAVWLWILKSWIASVSGHEVGTGKHSAFGSEAAERQKALSFEVEDLVCESVMLEEDGCVPGVLKSAVGARLAEVAPVCI